ncbi:unnamed protein product [Cochlearia groenlandica]
MYTRKTNLHVLLLSCLLISKFPSILGLSMRGIITRSEHEAFHGGDSPEMKGGMRKLMVTNLEVDYSSGDYDDGESSSSTSPPMHDYDDIYRRQGDVPSPGIGH